MRRVERLECLALASHEGVELGLFARDFGGEEQVLARRRRRERFPEILLGCVERALFTSNDAEILLRAGDRPHIIEGAGAS